MQNFIQYSQSPALSPGPFRYKARLVATDLEC